MCTEASYSYSQESYEEVRKKSVLLFQRRSSRLLSRCPDRVDRVMRLQLVDQPDRYAYYPYGYFMSYAGLEKFESLYSI